MNYLTFIKKLWAIHKVFHTLYPGLHTYCHSDLRNAYDDSYSRTKCLECRSILKKRYRKYQLSMLKLKHNG